MLASYRAAAESIYAKELSDMFRVIDQRGHINPDRPLLVSLTSETDSATAGWFPAGTFASRRPTRHRPARDDLHSVRIREPGTCIRPNPAFEENLRNPQGMMFATSIRATPEQLVWWRIEPLPSDKPTPYWIMHVPRKIIHEHSPIFTPEGRAMMGAIFRITNPKSQPGPRQMSID